MYIEKTSSGEVTVVNGLSCRLGAELVGTGLLVLFDAGAVLSALTLGGGFLDYAGLGMIAFSFGIVVAVVIYALGASRGKRSSRTGSGSLKDVSVSGRMNALGTQ